MKHPKSCKQYTIKYADEPFEFEVKTKDVKGSRVADTENCAAACALKSLPGVTRAWVTRARTVIEVEGQMLRYKNPAALRREVEKFDTTAGLFPPGKYRLQVVSEAERTHKRGKHRKTGGKPGLSRKRPSYALR